MIAGPGEVRHALRERLARVPRALGEGPRDAAQLALWHRLVSNYDNIVLLCRADLSPYSIFEGDEIGMKNVPKTWTIDDLPDVATKMFWET